MDNDCRNYYVQLGQRDKRESATVSAEFLVDLSIYLQPTRTAADTAGNFFALLFFSLCFMSLRNCLLLHFHCTCASAVAYVRVCTRVSVCVCTCVSECVCVSVCMFVSVCLCV